MEKKYEFQELNQLKERYLSLKRYNENSLETIEAYFDWYKKSCVIFSEYFDESNKDFKCFKNVDTSLNGYGLSTNFDQQAVYFEILINKILKNNNNSENKIINNIGKKIFISHSSKDKNIIEKFVNEILIFGLGLHEEDVFCTSIDGLGIKTGEDFRNYIKSTLIESDYSFIMISKNYKYSEVCLNEMGASWILDNVKVKQYLLPNLEFDSLSLLLNVQQAAKINDTCSLDELYDEFKSIYNLPNNTVRWNKNKNSFLTFCEQYIVDKSNFIIPHPNDYFQSYLQNDISINNLLLKAHPTLLDCKLIFSKEYYNAFFNSFCKKYIEIQNSFLEPLQPKYKYFKFDKISSKELLDSYIQFSKKICINDNLDFYKVSFLKNINDESGFCLKYFCYINERWVFIYKPYKLLSDR